MTLTIIARNPFTGTIGLAMASGSDDCIGGSVVMPAADHPTAPAFLVVQGKGDKALREELSRHWQAQANTQQIWEHLAATGSALALRQVLVAPLTGNWQARTGALCTAWAGDINEEHLLLAGNMLASEHVLPAMRAAYMCDLNAPMEQRLLLALEAGIAMGGDVRGHASAGILLRGSKQMTITAINAADPLAELVKSSVSA